MVRKIQLEAVQGPQKEITLLEATNRYFELRKDSPSASGLSGTMSTVLKIMDSNMLLSEISERHLHDFVQTRKSQQRKPQTIKHGINFITATMKLAKAEGFRVPDIQSPKVSIKRTRLIYLSVEDEKRLLKELDPNRHNPKMPDGYRFADNIVQQMQDNFDLVVVLLDTGARYGEIAKLTWDQIDVENSTIKLWRSKVSNERLIFMTARVLSIFKRRLECRSSKYVFTGKNGCHRGTGNTAIRKAFRRAGLDNCTIHTLRHTHASRLIQNGLSIYEVRSVLGHTDIHTTMRYAHLENVSVHQRARDVIEKIS